MLCLRVGRESLFVVCCGLCVLIVACGCLLFVNGLSVRLMLGVGLVLLMVFYCAAF